MRGECGIFAVSGRSDIFFPRSFSLLLHKLNKRSNITYLEERVPGHILSVEICKQLNYEATGSFSLRTGRRFFSSCLESKFRRDVTNAQWPHESGSWLINMTLHFG